MNPQNRTFLGAMAHAVKSLFLMLSNLINVADEGIHMLDKAVKVARKKQLIDITLTNADYETQMLNDAALRRSENQITIDEFINRSPRNKELFESAHDQLKHALDLELAELNKKK